MIWDPAWAWAKARFEAVEVEEREARREMEKGACRGSDASAAPRQEGDPGPCPERNDEPCEEGGDEPCRDVGDEPGREVGDEPRQERKAVNGPGLPVSAPSVSHSPRGAGVLPRKRRQGSTRRSRKKPIPSSIRRCLSGGK